MILFTNCADGGKRVAGMAQRRHRGAGYVRTGLSQDRNLFVKFVCDLRVTGSKWAEPAGRAIDEPPDDKARRRSGCRFKTGATRQRGRSAALKDGAWNGSPRSAVLFGANGLRAGPDGTLYLSADAEGSVLALRPKHMHR